MRKGFTTFLLAGVVVAIVNGVWAQCPDFKAPVGYPLHTAGDDPYVVDLNNDTRPDIAGAFSSNGSLHLAVIYGNGDGTFGAESTVAPTLNDAAILFADLNGDQKMDFINWNGGRFQPYLADGSGSFPRGTLYSVPHGSFDAVAAVADFNADGKVDFATAGTSNSDGKVELGVSLGDGTGAFGALSYFPLPKHSQAVTIAVGDLTGDGKVDVFVGEFDRNAPHQSAILPGNGNGTFQAAIDVDYGNAFGVDIGDVNNDGRPDLVLSRHEGVRVMLSNGDGTFQTRDTTITDLGFSDELRLTDIDLDGTLDVLVSDAFPIFILIGKGDGTFAAPAVVNYSQSGVGFAIGDFNADDRIDIVRRNSSIDTVYVLINQCARLVTVGEEIPRRSGTVAEQPEIQNVGATSGCTNANSAFWAPFTKRLYAVCDTDVKISWRVSANIADTRRLRAYTRHVMPTTRQPNIVNVPVSMARTKSGHSFVQVLYSSAAAPAVAADNTMTASVTGISVLLFAQANTPDIANNGVEFVVMESFAQNDATKFVDHGACVIGTKLTDPVHDEAGYTGFVISPNAHYDGAGPDRAYDRATRTGTIVPVNVKGTNDLTVVWYSVNALTGVAFPVKPVRYDCAWPASPLKIVIASQLGSDVDGQEELAVGKYQLMRIYNQPDLNQPGFNRNEEHALLVQSTVYPGSQAVYALRDDLAAGSEPYVLLKYNSGTEWLFNVYKVLKIEDPHTFTYTGTAATRIQPPYPLSILPACTQSSVSGVPGFVDHKNQIWAKAAGDMTAKYFYPIQFGFYTATPVGECVAWLDTPTPGIPIEVKYTISWPANIPKLAVGQTLTSANNGLPDIYNQAAAEIIYDQKFTLDSTSALALLIDPLTPASVTLDALPPNVVTGNEAGLKTFEKAPPHIRSRLRYDPGAKKLSFRGIYDGSSSGDPLVLLNVMSLREREAIKALDPDNSDTFKQAVDDLYKKCRNPRDLNFDGTAGPDDGLLIGFDRDSSNKRKRFRVLGTPGALSAGAANGKGYLTLAFNNDPKLGALPVSLSVIEVDCGPYQGQVNIISPENIFDEKLTLRHSGDFLGEPSAFNFEWYTHVDVDGTPPAPPTLNPDGSIADARGWFPYQSGAGVNDITIQNADLRTLSDNWFLVRYNGYTTCPNKSAFAGAPGGSTAQLAQGWIKRVTDRLNPFESRVNAFHKTPAATYASMLTIGGERYEGDVALSNDPNVINSLGLIPTYETVLRRGMSLSVNGTPPINYDPANLALLNAAGRISDFYSLFGNEAFADAADPTIGFGTQSGEYGTLAPAIFAFQNQLNSLLDEELALLRGRDTSSAPVTARPAYNRLFWNFTSGNGEFAYAQNYAISDQNNDGRVDEVDARTMFPQGHGDAWGHYLTALTTYFKLLRNKNFTWNARSEAVVVSGVPIQVGYQDERRFARAAAALARTGSQVVDLTYRRNYIEDPRGQYQGYKDTDTDRAWGVVEWARRASQGAYFDWLVANALLPDKDPEACAVLGIDNGTPIPGSNPPRLCHSGISRSDRTTVTEISEIVSNADEIQAQLDKADRGLNPLGLAKNVVPFDIDPAVVLSGKTHFEQVYDRAFEALNNTLTVFNHVNQLSLSLRRNQDTLSGFNLNVQQRERDLRNRLIEIFGYPYPEDIGPAGTYPTGYAEADIYHYMYVDPSELTGDKAPETVSFTAYYTSTPGVGKFIGDTFEDPFAEKGTSSIKEVIYHQTLDGTAVHKPSDWTGRRRAPGEIQLALSELLQSRAQLERSILQYGNHIKAIEGKVGDIASQSTENSETLKILNEKKGTLIDLNIAIGVMKGVELGTRRAADTVEKMGEATVDTFPKVVGLANDIFAPIRGATKFAANVARLALNVAGDAAEVAGNSMDLAKEGVELNADIDLQTRSGNVAISNLVSDLETLVRQEPVLRLEVYERRAAVNQSIQRYLAAVASGERVLDELVQFRRNTAANVQQYRYEDMTFRVFRNDALQKYRAQFDLAARYTYLAATAYDYETNLLGDANGSGREFLTTIVQQRGLGQVINGVPIAGSRGLADPLARMSQNFAVLKGQMGFNNPQTETNRFSLRTEFARLRSDTASDGDWRDKLQTYRKANLWDIPEFRRFCRPFALESPDRPEPGIVIEFPSTVTFGQNFFGEKLAGGDSAYDASHFATKIRSVGVWFTNYNGTGLSNTPRVYLVPAGNDFMRSPSGNLATREWSIIDQKIPVPFPIGAAQLSSAEWLPMNNLSDEFGDIRRFSSFRAYHDPGSFTPAETSSDTRLIGRSVWNSKWMLIIPGGTLLNDANAGLDTFINSVKDIKVFFQTYAYSGN